MKIFYIYTALTTKGGADRVITEKANWLAEHGYDVTIVTDTQMGRQPVFPLSSKVRLIDFAIDFSKEYGHTFMVRIYMYLKLMRIYRRMLKALLMRERPDVVITTLGRDIDFIATINDGSIKIGEAHTTKCFIRNFHLLEKRNLIFKYLTKFFRWRMDRQINKLNALVVLASQHAGDWKCNVPIYVIPNSLPFYPDQYSTCENKHAIAVGRYNDAKGYDYMIAAWEIVHQRHPDWILDIYGSGELHDQVIGWIQEKKLTSTIIPHDPVDTIMEKYLESSICILSSRYEGFPMVLVESMACGVPVVSFDCPYGPQSIIRHNINGLLVEYLNTQSLADNICHLIEDDDLRKRLGACAKKDILCYTKDNIMEKLTNLFSELKNNQA